MKRNYLIVLFALLINGFCLAQINDLAAKDKNIDSISIKPYLNSITVSNLDAAVNWYHNNLGFSVTKKIEQPEYSLRIAFMELNGFHLELIEFKKSVGFAEIINRFPIVNDRAKVQGFFKLGFLVDDLEKLTGMLKRNSVKFERDITKEETMGVKFILVDDIDGNAIQFFQILN